MATKFPGKPAAVEAAPTKLGDLLLERLFVVRTIKYNREHTALLYFGADYSPNERVERAKEWCIENDCRFMFLEPRPAISVVS